MKMQVFNDTFTGTAAEIVQEMHKTAWMVEPSATCYMRVVARRMMYVYGLHIRYDNAEQFLSELVRLGVAHRLDN